MIHDEIVTYEVAKLAKEKGFDEATYYIYDKEDKRLNRMRYCVKRNSRIGSIIKLIAAPTQSLLQRWLREEKKYAISVFWDMLSKDYRYEIVKTIGVLEIQAGEKYNYSNPKGFDTYELALEDALKYALENLV